MTSVFVPEITERQEWVRPCNERDQDALQALDGTALASSWAPVPVEMIRDDNGTKLDQADLPWVGGHALTFRDTAVGIARALLEPVGEFLELNLVDERERLWLFNVTLVIDALDEDRSDLVRFPSTGRVMKVNRHEFRSSEVAAWPAFRVPQLRTLFVAGSVAESLRGAGVSGTSFREVWAG